MKAGKSLFRGVEKMHSSSKIFKNAPVRGTSFYGQADQVGAAGAAARTAADKSHLPGAPDMPSRRIPGSREITAAPPPPEQPPVCALPDREETVKKWVEAGYAEGTRKAELECRRLREEAARTVREAGERLEEARRRSKEIIAASEQEVVRMAVAAAESLLRCQLDLSPEKILQVVRHTIQNLPEGEAVEVFVNPADLPACRENLENLRGEMAAPAMEITPDETLARGSCRGETASTIAEYFLEEERERMAERLREVARREEQKRFEEAEREYARH